MADYKLESPSIVVLPAEAEIGKAVERLKQQPNLNNWLSGVTEIVVESIPGKLGYVTNKEGDENKIFVDYYRLKSDLMSRQPGMAQQDLEEALIGEIMQVISHEKGHLAAGLDAGEAPAEQAQQATADFVMQQNQQQMPIAASIDLFYQLVKTL